MPRFVKITRIIVTHFDYRIPGRAMAGRAKLDMLYQPGSTVSSGGRGATSDHISDRGNRCRRARRAARCSGCGDG